MPRELTHTDYVDAAELLRCEVAALQAVSEVEAPGGGFLRDGRLRVLFEGHKFFEQTQGKFKDSHPTLCFQKWTRQYYARGKDAEERGARELVRLNTAIALDRTAALCSASYGKFQIMGFNYKKCLFPSVETFYTSMGTDEQAQLAAFCHFIKCKGLLGALQGRDWPKFARGYNGSGFRANDYDGKLRRAYQKFARG